MEMNYNEVQNKLGELNKVVYVMEQSVKAINRYENGTPYAHIPISILRREINELNSKIEDLKSRAVVNYQEDTSYIDALLASNEDKNDIQ